MLPTLPNCLLDLWCYHNYLTVLPTLSSLLTHLYCEKNKLTVLPGIPQSLKRLYCNNNLVTFLPVLPKKLEFKSYNNNPVNTYIREKCGGDLEIYYYDTEIYATKLVRWYLNCRENPKFKFCRDRLNKEYDALMNEDTDGIMS